MKRFSRRQFIQLTGGLAMASILPRPQLSMAGMWAKLFGEPKRDIAPITPNDEFLSPPIAPRLSSLLNSGHFQFEDW